MQPRGHTAWRRGHSVYKAEARCNEAKAEAVMFSLKAEAFRELNIADFCSCDAVHAARVACQPHTALI